MTKILIDGRQYIIPITDVTLLERAVVEAVLWQTGFNVTLAATQLGMPRATLYRKMSNWGISRSEFLKKYGEKLGVKAV